MPPHVFALDASALAYGRFVRAESGFEVEDLSRRELPEGLFADGPLGGPMHDPGLFEPVLGELLENVEGSVSNASLVLPDAWLRVAFTEMSDVPSRGARRDEALRWKLKRQVPFRVEELRLEGIDVTPLPSQEEGQRLLLGFALDAVLSQVEDAFADCGVRIGRILNSSLATVDAVQEVVEGVDLAAVVLVSAGGYSLTFTERGQPLLHRFRALDSGLAGDAAARLVLRDLKLTRTFLQEQLPGRELARVLLISEARQQRFWLDSLEQGLGQVPVALGREQLPLRGRLPDVSPALLAPMLGAAGWEIAG
ncbi:MAG: hypothetical protein O7A04_01285 [Acidobacteria bacterium]|nr:hypothetical protein [Acidobacteriota bacterium]